MRAIGARHFAGERRARGRSSSGRLAYRAYVTCTSCIVLDSVRSLSGAGHYETWECDHEGAISDD